MKKKILLFLLILYMGLIPKVTLAETYDGEYTIEYLLKNYNLVTTGIKNINMPSKYQTASKGNVQEISQIEGAVLINGDFLKGPYNDSNTFGNFGSLAGNTNSYVKGEISGNIIPNRLVTDQNYIDFNKLYEEVMNESYALIENAEYHINNQKLEIEKPGNYIINDTAANISGNIYESNPLLIKNYDRNNVYIFNYYNEYILYLPVVKIMEQGSANAITLKEFMNSGNYTGNIIFNLPNAKYIEISGFSRSSNYNYGICGNIVAPKANIYLSFNYYSGSPYSFNYYGNIITNSINSQYNNNYYNSIKKANYTLDKKLLEDYDKYSKEPIDYNDDYYSRDYSISDLLKNYSLVTLGHKQIDSKSKLLEYGNNAGSIKLFHVTGQALIAGDLYGKVYNGIEDDYYKNYSKLDRTAFDMESNEVCESYIKGNIFLTTPHLSGNSTFNYSFISVIQPWDNMAYDNSNYLFRKNALLIGTLNPFQIRFEGNFNFDSMDSYINFDRLYNNIVSEQSKIEDGTSITPSNGKAHVRVGGSYIIEDINDINEIVFDNFDDEKDKITIITIKNTGDINFPLISKDTGSYKGIVTNDYYGKEKATHFYEQDTFVQDSYHGNIIWNIPNATYIKLKEGAPFAGHLIAPNADVDTPETHFAGCFIVNSIYGEGNTEAHFYPLTATATYDVPEYDDLTSSELSNLSNMRLKRLLGGKGSQIETTVIGNEEEFRREEAKLNNIIGKEENNKNNVIPPIIDILQNPLTKRNILIIISALIIISVVLGLTFKKKSKR